LVFSKAIKINNNKFRLGDNKLNSFTDSEIKFERNQNHELKIKKSKYIAGEKKYKNKQKNQYYHSYLLSKEDFCNKKISENFTKTLKSLNDDKEDYYNQNLDLISYIILIYLIFILIYLIKFLRIEIGFVSIMFFNFYFIVSYPKILLLLKDKFEIIFNKFNKKMIILQE